MSHLDVKQVIVVRTKFPDGKGGTFGMRTGKLAAQVAHASLQVFVNLSKNQPVSCADIQTGARILPSVLDICLTRPMTHWLWNGAGKIVVGVETEADLLHAHALAIERGIPTALIQDLGYTEFHGVPTYTTCAIGPDESSLIDEITGPQGLVRVKLL